MYFSQLFHCSLHWYLSDTYDFFNFWMYMYCVELKLSFNISERHFVKILIFPTCCVIVMFKHLIMFFTLLLLSIEYQICLIPNNYFLIVFYSIQVTLLIWLNCSAPISFAENMIALVVGDKGTIGWKSHCDLRYWQSGALQSRAEDNLLNFDNPEHMLTSLFLTIRRTC